MKSVLFVHKFCFIYLITNSVFSVVVFLDSIIFFFSFCFVCLFINFMLCFNFVGFCFK